MLADSPEAQIVTARAPIYGEPVVDKGCVDPFVGTRRCRASARWRSGGATNLVVEPAARHANNAGLQVTVVEDICASFRPDFHAFSVQNMLPLSGTVTSADELLGGRGMSAVEYDVVVGGGVAICPPPARPPSTAPGWR